MNTNNMDTQYDVFISYSHYDYIDENKEVIPNNPVSEIMQLLKDNHLSYWIDEKGIFHGDEFLELLAENIENSKILLFLSSKNSNKSDWTSKEISAATQWKKKIIPVRLDDSSYNRKVMLQISDLDYVEYYKNPALAQQSLISSIQKYKKEYEEKRAIEEQERQRQEKEKKELALAEERRKEQEELANEISRAIQTISTSEEVLEKKRLEQKKQIDTIDSKSKQKDLLLALEKSNLSAFEERTQCRLLSKQIDSLNSEIDSLKQEAEKTIKEKLASGEYVTREAVEQIKQTANAEAEENIRIALDAQAKKYQTTIEELKKKCTTLESQLAELRKSVEKINQDKDTLSKSKEELRKKCDSLAENLASVNASYQRLIQVNASLIKDNSELTNQQKKLEGEVSELESANSTLRNNNSRLSSRISELRQTIAENNTQLASLSSKNKRYKLYVWLLLALLILSTIISFILIPSSDSEHESDSDPTEEVVVEPETADRSFTVKGVSFKMVKVAGGTFTMGATAEQEYDAYDVERPAHQVTLSDYYIGQTEVTQALWTAVMGSNPSYFKGDNLPVAEVSWYDCQTFIDKLNSLFSNELGGMRFAFPTEAQWEFAARGGNQSQGYKYAGSNNIDDVAWYWFNSDKQKHPVAQKRPNELGLYDMSGNVWEWCQDWYGRYSSNAQTNPQGPASGTNRVKRGGSWRDLTLFCRVSNRSHGTPDYRDLNVGFRLCLLP